MVRTRMQKTPRTQTITLILDPATKAHWKDLKGKFKFRKDEEFLAFLLELAKNEYSWSRRKRICTSENESEQTSGKSKNNLVALRFQHLGNRHYRVLNDFEPNTDSSQECSKTTNQRSIRKCAICKSKHRENSCPNLLKNFLGSQTECEQAGLVTKIYKKVENTLLEDDSQDNYKKFPTESYAHLGIFPPDHSSKSELPLKVSDMVKSRFDDDDDSVDDIPNTLLRAFDEKDTHGGENKAFDNNTVERISTDHNTQVGTDLGAEVQHLSKIYKNILSPLSTSAENTQDVKPLNGTLVCKPSSKGPAEKENQLTVNFASTNETGLPLITRGNVREEAIALIKEGNRYSEVSGNREGNKPTEVVWEPGLPAEFVLRVVDALHGPSVIVNAVLATGEQLGPLTGILVREMEIPEDSNMHDIWQVGTEDEPRYLSTREAEHSNWLRHIRPAPNQEQANCLTVVLNRQLFFRTTRRVDEGEELLYWTDCTHSKWTKKRLDKTSCGGCNLQLGHVLYYRTHCMLFHDPSRSLNIRKYYCKVCGVPVLGKDKIIGHAVTSHEGKGAYQCQFCQKFFLRLRHLELHRNYGCANNPNRSKAKCDLCSREFSQPQKLKVHKRRMHNDMTEVVLKEFQCEHCKKILGSGTGLLRHKKEVHNKDLAAATCDRCGKIFQNKSNLKIHMLTHSGIKPFKCQQADCNAGFTTKQRLVVHYKNAHGIDGDALPKIQRSVAFTFDAYCGNRSESHRQQDSANSSPPPIEENQSEGMSPLSVGCSADLPPLSVPRPDEYSEEDTGDDENKTEENILPYGTETGGLLPYNGGEMPLPLPSKGSRKWLGSPALYRMDNYSASLLVEEAICAAEKDIIEKDVIDGVLPYDALPPYIGSPPLEEQPEPIPRDYSSSSPTLEDQRDVLRSHLYSSSSPTLEDNRVHSYNQSSPPLEEPREMLRTHILQRNYTPPLSFKGNVLSRDYCVSSPPLEEPRDVLKTNSLLRDYNISSLIREDLQEGDQDGRGRGLIDPGKDPEVSEYRGTLYRDESRDGLSEFRRQDLYRREGYDSAYQVESEAQNLSLKEKTLQLDLPYKTYESLEELERIGRDPGGLETLLVGEQGNQPMGRPLHLSPRYPPTYDTESMDLTLPRLPYPSSPIYSLDMPTRFDLPSGRLVDLRSHLGLSPHRFPAARVVSAGAGSPPSSSYLYQPTFAAPSARHSPTPSYHPYPTYY